MEAEHEILYDDLIRKYGLNRTRPINYSINLEIDDFINNLNKCNHETKIYESNNKDYIIYVSNRLLKFLNDNDYILDSILFYTKLYNKILNVADLYRFVRIKNTDDEIYNDIRKISTSNYLGKKALINNFINKYSSKSESININI